MDAGLCQQKTWHQRLTHSLKQSFICKMLTHNLAHFVAYHAVVKSRPCTGWEQSFAQLSPSIATMHHIEQ